MKLCWCFVFIDQGSFKLPLYQCPVDMKEWNGSSESSLHSADASVTLTLFAPSEPPAEKSVNLFIRYDAAALARQPFIQHNAGKPSDKLFEKVFLSHYISLLAFGSQSQSSSFQYILLFSDQGDGFDLYVDGARFLPDNVSISRVFVQLFTCDGELLHSTSQVCAPDGTIYSPTYGLRNEFRGLKQRHQCLE